MTTTEDRSKRRYTLAVISKDGTRHSFHEQTDETLNLALVRVTSGLGLLLTKGDSEAYAYGPGDITRLGVKRTADAKEDAQ